MVPGETGNPLRQVLDKCEYVRSSALFKMSVDISRITRQGKYTLHGKREQHIVYAQSEAECEQKLAEMIREIKEQNERN